VSPDPFDAIDRALSSGLSSLAPEVPGGDETLAALRPRFERARTRSRVVKIGGTIVALLAIGSVATLAAPHSQRTHVSVSSPSSVPKTTSRPTRPSTTISSTTTAPPTSTVTTPTTGGSNPSKGGPGATTPATVPTFVPGTTPSGNQNPGSSGGHGDGHGQSGSSTTTTFPSSHDGQTYTAPGGAIVVQFSHGSLRLIDVRPVHGYTARIDDRGPDRVRVRFLLGGAEKSRIEIDIKNGRPVRVYSHGN